MAKIENHKYSIEEAFRECFYIVPDYQREYIWKEKEVTQLLDDINDEIEDSQSKEYFIGTVIVSPSIEKNSYEVIDGQQRLTTLFLTLCALRNLFQGEKQSQLITTLISANFTNRSGDIVETLKLAPRYGNANEVLNKLIEFNGDTDKVRKSIQTSSIPAYGSLENLLTAYETASRFLKENYTDLEKLKKYWSFLAHNVVFIQISTDVSSALKIFETINERGVGLNSMDLLKNLLFSNVKLDEFDKLKTEWKKITEPLEKQKEKPLRFLRYYLMANYKIDNKRSDGIVREDEIYDWFIDKKNAALCEHTTKPFEFVRKIISNVDQFINFSKGRGNDGKENVYLNNLSEECGSSFSLHFVLLLSASSFPKLLFDHFVKQLESFLFFYIFTKTPTKDLERSFSLWADELRTIGALTSPAEQIKSLNIFLIEKFQTNVNTKKDELTDRLRRYTTSSMQKYRTRYLLAKFTQYVDMEYKGLKNPGSINEYTVLEMEHILPDNPKEAVKNDFVLNNPDKDYNLYKIKLGNMTLLEKPINIVASNNYFQTKWDEYRKCKNYLTSSIPELISVGSNTSITRINSKLSSYANWNAVDIEKRQETLIGLVFDIWKIEEIS